MNFNNIKSEYYCSKSELKNGVNFVCNNEVVVFVKENQIINAILNKCQHMKGRFKEISSCKIKCPSHNWSLNLESLNYENPKGIKHLDKLNFKEKEDKIWFYSERKIKPLYWENGREKTRLGKKEFGISYYSHACIKISTPKLTFFTDPWLTGPAFTKGWWLLHHPPENWLSDISNSDGIYISHNHSDHLNIHTLQEILKINPEVCFYIPKFESDDIQCTLKSIGFKNFKILNFYDWFELAQNVFFMILPDGTGRNDSGFLFEYKGHRILSTVDCSNCCSGDLPKNVDVLLSTFASGASGFPVCWEEQYSLEEINKITAKNRSKALGAIVSQAKNSGAKAFIPYAGYFVEAHPDDLQTKRLNRKNTPDDAKAYLNVNAPEILVHIPSPSDFFDVGHLEADLPETFQLNDNNTWNIEYYDTYYKNNGTPLEEKQIEEYFHHLNFNDELLLHILECDDQFNTIFREYSYNFKTQLFSLGAPEVQKGINYLRMKVRQNSFSTVLRQKLPWEEISIGFQVRFFRDPDIYNFSFWHHMQNLTFKQ